MCVYWCVNATTSQYKWCVCVLMRECYYLSVQVMCVCVLMRECYCASVQVIVCVYWCVNATTCQFMLLAGICRCQPSAYCTIYSYLFSLSFWARNNTLLYDCVKRLCCVWRCEIVVFTLHYITMSYWLSGFHLVCLTVWGHLHNHANSCGSGV